MRLVKKHWHTWGIMFFMIGIAVAAYAATVNRFPYGAASPRWYGMDYGDTSSLDTYYAELPTLLSNDTITTNAASQTLTNKTLTAPTIAGATVNTTTLASPTITGTATATSATLTGCALGDTYDIMSASAGEAMSANTWVCIATADGELYKADSDTSNRRPAIGVILADCADGERVDVVVRGEVGGFSGLVAGYAAWLSDTAGSETLTPPEGFSQSLGMSTGTTTLLVSPGGTYIETVTAKTANYTLTDADSITGTITNDGASAEITITMLDTSTGYEITIANAESYTLNIDPVTGDQILGLTNATGDKIRSTSAGDTVTLKAINATQWVVTGYNGTWADAN